ncbi:MAG: GIY-YIG nuclease family protein, partial [Candidatus Omnitrophica bacterium]|nr:GIY-YIG nuclease family protein [Candidatus Omnitrophota bacterium]
KIKTLPDSPGVYLMKNSGGDVIYVGKAASLKKRVRSYFRERPLSARLSALVNNISDVEFILTANEAEALLLESALIKSRQPKYNVALRDDKNYPLLKLTTNEKFPRLFIARMKKNDGATYFGPYTEAKLLRKSLSFLKRVFPLRTCKTMPKSLCLNFYLGQCNGPCVGKIDAKKYEELTNRLIMFLEGKKPELVKQLETEMIAASKEKRYEGAAGIRGPAGCPKRDTGLKEGSGQDRSV